MRELTAKQARFVDEYLIDLNATQAAIRAGYSKKTSGQIGDENLKKPQIAEVIAERMADRSKTSWLTREKVLADIEAIKANAAKIIHDKDGNEVMVNHAAALKAAELHGKHLGLFVDKIEHSGSMTLESLVSESMKR